VIVDLWLLLLIGYLVGVLAMAGGIVHRFRTDPEMRSWLAEDPTFTKAVSLLTVLLWPGVPVVLPVLRRINRRIG
jgi:hypothetical protein